jgi:hypothetical protein
MADYDLLQAQQIPEKMVSKYKDMGDGTHAPTIDLGDRLGRLVGRITNYDVLSNGTLAAAEATVELNAAGLGTIGLGISGTWVGTIVAEITVGDGVWDALPLIDQLTGAAAASTTGNGNWILGVGGSLTLRIRASAWTSGTATVYLEGSSVGSGVMLTRSIPTGGNLIGSVLGAAGENHIGQVGGEGTTISQTPTVTAGAYGANDAVGGLLTFANAARVATFTAMGDNAAWAPSQADLRKLVAIVSTTDGAWYAAGTPSAARIEVSQRYDLVGTSMFGQLVTRGTPTFAATDDVTVIISLQQD